jgi:hypothetical protein
VLFSGGGSIVPPSPISLQEPGRFRVFLEDVSNQFVVDLPANHPGPGWPCMNVCRFKHSLTGKCCTCHNPSSRDWQY